AVFCFTLRRQPRPPLSPYTTLFRSLSGAARPHGGAARAAAAAAHGRARRVRTASAGPAREAARPHARRPLHRLRTATALPARPRQPPGARRALPAGPARPDPDHPPPQRLPGTLPTRP